MEESSRFCVGWLLLRRVCMASRKQGHIEQITERCLIAQKNLVSRNELRQIEYICARDLDVLIANFLLQVREFLFLICVKKTIVIKTNDKKYERRFDRSTVIFKFKFMDKIIPHIYNF